MTKEWTWAIISFVIIGAIGCVLLYLGASGALPMGLGLFDMSQLGVRIVVIAILLVALGALFYWYRNTPARTEQ
jgi:hypothetical protein